MNTLLNTSRPPAFCPGCSHERITHRLDKVFQNLGLPGHRIALVTDIGCSGLFDTFFNTHAMHGLHGRALTYGAGLKLARPDLTVVVTMGDGGLGIGGAHLLAACRRNLNLTLLILNNFNFGMTGGQFSATTPAEARAGSGFLNRLEKPFDVCETAAAAGAAYVVRCSAYQKDLEEIIQNALTYDGFSLVDIWGVCPGRFTRSNRLTPKIIEEQLAALPPFTGGVARNRRKEYGTHYREISGEMKPIRGPQSVTPAFSPPDMENHAVVMLGSAGQRIVTAGELLCLAAMTAGLHATQKSDYPITVLRGRSITEVMVSPKPVTYIGIERPTVILALAQEGIDRSRALLAAADENTLILHDTGLRLPPSQARILPVDFKELRIKGPDRALASLAILAGKNRVISRPMLEKALEYRFSGAALESAKELVERFKDG